MADADLKSPTNQPLRLSIPAKMGILLVSGILLGFAFNPDGLRPTKTKNRQESEVTFFRAPDVELDEFRRHFESGNCLVVDARSGADFVAGHIPGALAARDQNSKNLTSLVRNWLPHEGLVLVVDSHPMDFRARRLASNLRLAGVSGARPLKGGMEAWRKAGLPIVVGWDMDEILEASRR